jgi:hypothetical protein
MKLKHDITIMTLKTKTEHCFYLIRQLALLSDNNAANGMFNAIVCLVTLKIGKTIPKKSTGYQIYFLIIFILRTD